MKPHQFQCAHCEEIKSSEPIRYIRSEEKIKKLICADCKKLEKSNYKYSKVEHKGEVSNPKRTLSSNARIAGAQKAIDNSNDQWELFKQSYRQFDISIQLQSTYIKEIDLPSDITELSSDALELEVEQLTQRLNQLRSMAYHLARKKAFQQKLDFEIHMANVKEAELKKKRENERRDAARLLKAPHLKRLYRTTGKLPIELMKDLAQIFLELQDKSKGEINND